jgi:transcription-repair coupling factor (superfamily II helicase)
MKAYAYLLLPRHLMIEADARKRVSAIKQYSYLGAGFKIAMRDLEIRGAGNILGTEQSGHATAIGFELYCQLLKETLARMKGEKVAKRIEVRVRLDFLSMSEDSAVDGIGAYIPKAYMNESRLRIQAYRRLAEIGDEKELETLGRQWADRFGKLPKQLLWLIELARIKIVSSEHGITSVEVEEDKVMLQKGGGLITVGGKFLRLSPVKSSQVQKKLEELLKITKSLGISKLARSLKLANIDFD